MLSRPRITNTILRLDQDAAFYNGVYRATLDAFALDSVPPGSPPAVRQVFQALEILSNDPTEPSKSLAEEIIDRNLGPRALERVKYFCLDGAANRRYRRKAFEELRKRAFLYERG